MADLHQLQEEAQSLRDEAKSIERRARLLKQMTARHVEHLSEYSQSKEDTEDGNQQDSVA